MDLYDELTKVLHYKKIIKEIDLLYPNNIPDNFQNMDQDELVLAHQEIKRLKDELEATKKELRQTNRFLSHMEENYQLAEDRVGILKSALDNVKFDGIGRLLRNHYFKSERCKYEDFASDAASIPSGYEDDTSEEDDEEVEDDEEDGEKEEDEEPE